MSKKIHLVYIVNTLGYGGTEKAVELVAARLPRSSYSISVIALHAGGIREAHLREAGITVVVAQDDLDVVKTYLQQHPADIVHIHYVKVPLSLFADSRLFLHHHFSHPLYSAAEYELFEHVVFNSQRTRQKFYELTRWPLNMERDVVVYSPVETGSLAKRVQSIPDKYLARTRKSYGISDTDVVLGRFGRPDIVKWSDTVIYALPLLVREIPNFKFIIQSAPRSRAWLLRYSPWKNHLVLNPVTDPKYQEALFYRLIDVYAHAAKIGESFGLTLVEAGAAQKPVVVLSTPKADNAQIEVIYHNKTGMVVSDSVQFAHACARLSTDAKLQHRLGKNGYTKALEQYDTSHIVSALDRLYQRRHDVKQNAREYASWQKEYRRRLTQTFASPLSPIEKVYLSFITILSYGTRIADVIEHHFDV